MFHSKSEPRIEIMYENSRTTALFFSVFFGFWSCKLFCIRYFSYENVTDETKIVCSVHIREYFEVCPFGNFGLQSRNRMPKVVYTLDENQMIELRTEFFFWFSHCVYPPLYMCIRGTNSFSLACFDEVRTKLWAIT